jgi:hopanoid biosynthesis associated protein HpnK
LKTQGLSKRLIVNADDFGLTESVNRGIMVAHREGILTSTSLLANGSAFDQAVSLSQHFPRLSVGVHLNLSEGKAVSPASRIPSLANGQGELHLSPVQLWSGILRRQVSLDHIHSECRAQILKVFDAGIKPTHLDGHLHVHVLPQLSPVVIGIAEEFDICHIRCPLENLETTLPVLWKMNGASIGTLQRSAIGYGVSSFARRFREQLRVAGLSSPGAFFGLAHTGFLNAQALAALLALVPDGITELMCHPGYASGQLESLGGSLAGKREAEVLALTAPGIREMIRSVGIRLISFRDLEEIVPTG